MSIDPHSSGLFCLRERVGDRPVALARSGRPSISCDQANHPRCHHLLQHHPPTIVVCTTNADLVQRSGVLSGRPPRPPANPGCSPGPVSPERRTWAPSAHHSSPIYPIVTTTDRSSIRVINFHSQAERHRPNPTLAIYLHCVASNTIWHRHSASARLSISTLCIVATHACIDME